MSAQLEALVLRSGKGVFVVANGEQFFSVELMRGVIQSAQEAALLLHLLGEGFQPAGTLGLTAEGIAQAWEPWVSPGVKGRAFTAFCHELCAADQFNRTHTVRCEMEDSQWTP
jgi:hypothetical protein